MTFATVDEYLGALPPASREVAEQVWSHVCRAVPDGQPTIAYGIPTLKVNARAVVHMGVWTSHLSIYPLPHHDAKLREQVAPYASGRGTLKFALSSTMPFDLIERVAAALRAEHDEPTTR